MNRCFSRFLFGSLVLFCACSSFGDDNPDAENLDTVVDSLVGDVVGNDVDEVLDVMADVEKDGEEIRVDSFHEIDSFDSLTGDTHDVVPDTPDSGEVFDAVSEVESDAVDPGSFGWPCETNEDCLAGICVLTDDGRVCSMECSTVTCPDGFSCEPVSLGGEVTLVCMPAFVNLCRPCETAADCRLGLSSTAGMTCREFGPEIGSFCLAPCAGSCPEGYECQDAGDGKSWCMPLSGMCDCSVTATAASALTSCSVGVAGIETRCFGVRTCGPDGLSECSALPPEGEKCNGVDDDCDGLTDEAGAVDCKVYYFDLDGDGQGLDSVAKCLCGPSGSYRAETAGDCDDGNPDINSSVDEQCNGIDDNCDGVTDEAGAERCRVYYADVDGDSWGSNVDSLCLCQPTAPYISTRDGDCDDGDEQVFPGATDICNGVDDNCDGTTDPENGAGCVVWYQDSDGDTYGNEQVSKCLCAPNGTFTATKVGDCNDSRSDINPGMEEACNGFDDNCDGLIDPEGSAGCTSWLADRDDDSFGVLSDSQCLCRKTGVYTAVLAGDCDDSNPDVRPDAFEVCGNSIDENCNGFVSEAGALNCQIFMADRDLDGFGDDSSTMCLCAAEAPYISTIPGDCNDNDFGVSPSALELCGNFIDDDCNGDTDEAGCAGCVDFYLDMDQDGFGVPGFSMCLSAPESSGYSARAAGDCNDGNQQVYPGAPEVCNGIDDNCDGVTDPEGSVSCIVFYLDFDGDGYGVSSNSRCLCAPEGNYTAVDDGDCDDMNPKVGGGAEVCNGVDDNCNGRVDEENAGGCVLYYLDDDGDGVGVDSSSRCLCSADGRYSTRIAGDCDDSSVSIRPGASDTCNGIDDDCDGVTDPENANGCQVWYRDMDGDGYGVDGQGKCLCGPGDGYVTKLGGDCNDGVRSISPAGLESCNGLDDNCDGVTDGAGSLGCVNYYADRDGDSWGNYNDFACLCQPEAPWLVTRPGDCDDSTSAVGPGGTETCNGLDDDCDGLTDEYGAAGCTSYFKDSDRDGYGVPDSALCACAPEGTHDALVGGDCNDDNPLLNPGMPEVCNGVDDNCDGLKDPAGSTGCTEYMIDRDSDGFGIAGDTACMCAPTYPYTSLISGDCDDTRAAARPGAQERCNGFDDNCDGISDVPGSEGCLIYYRDADDDGWAISDWMCLCSPEAPYTAEEARGDCDDNNADVNAGMDEVCDGFDNDCNGITDDDGASGCLVRYLDADGDGWGVADQSVCRCGSTPPYSATRTGDCDDSRDDIAPGKQEVCNGFDDNCDGVTDPENTSGCIPYYIDQDLDGYGQDGDSKCLCAGTGSYTASAGGDCNDLVAAINPGKTEICGNDLDDNCSGAQDEEGAVGCQYYFKDSDTDGYGDESTKKCLCGPGLVYKVRTGGDCCDSDDKAYPGNGEWQTIANECGSWDYNCDGRVTKRWNDGYGSCGGWGVFDGCDLDQGWKGAVPSCGVKMDYVVGGCGYCGFLWLSCCSEDRESRTQSCY